MSLHRDPLHMQIARVLRSEISRNYEIGARFPSQNELAKRFNVSPPTAREAVGLLVQDGLLERRFGSGTYVTEKKTEQWIGIVIELDISDRDTSYFFLRTVQVLRTFFAEHELPARLYPGHSRTNDREPPPLPTCEEFFSDLDAGRLTGMLTLSYAWSTPFQALVDTYALPCVGETGRTGGPDLDHAGLLQQAAAYCAAHGARRVAVIRHGQDKGGSGPIGHSGIRRCLAEAGLTCRDDWNIGVWPESDVPDAVSAFRRIWQEPVDRPDALIVLDDALYAQIAPILLYNRISIPDDLLVLAHGNVGDSRVVHPEPVRLLFDPDEFAVALGHCMLTRLHDPQAPLQRRLIHATLQEPATVAETLLEMT